jgi:Icc protein
MGDGKPIRVVQLSDCHLFADVQGKLLGLNTEFSLGKVLELIESEQPHPDLVLATGDLSQDGSGASYQRFHEHMKHFSAPVYWLPGNHDLMTMMRHHQALERMSPCVISMENWRIILLDSTIVGKVPGRFSDAELTFLDHALSQCSNRHVLVCLHHQPVPVGSAWLDEQIVGNAEQFFTVVDRYPEVRGIIWGHVHQVFEAQRNGVRLLSVPSTCVQFKPGSQDFCVDTAAPGYRWLDLYADGRIETAVSRVTGVTFEVDYRIKGY